jgi:hypothetical protein
VFQPNTCARYSPPAPPISVPPRCQPQIAAAEPAPYCSGRQHVDAVGVDHHVLGGRHEGYEQHGRGDHEQVGGGLGAGQHHDRHDQQALGEQGPAAAPAEAVAEERQSHAVHQRRPQEIDGIGRRGEREQPDVGPRHALVAQPDGQVGEYQRRRQAAREAQREQRGHAAITVRLEQAPETVDHVGQS